MLLDARLSPSATKVATTDGIMPLISAAKPDKPGLKIKRFELPGQIVRIDRNAVSAQPGTRIERGEPKGLGGGGVDYFVDVDSQKVTHQRELVHHADIHAAESIFEKLDHLGTFGARHRNYPFNKLRIKKPGDLGASGT